MADQRTDSVSPLLDSVRAGYTFQDPAITLGAAIVDGAVHADAPVRLPLAMMNRHGLVAGATGTGKTVTLQVMAEQLSEAGVPVFLADIKGDLSGLATAGTASEKLTERTTATGMDWSSSAYPVEFLALGGDGTGIPVRATVDSFGPLLLARVMDLNETQESSLQLMFHWANQRDLPLDDLKDLRAVVVHLTSPEGKADLKELGGVATATANVILREITALQASGMDPFFGVPEFETGELLRQAPDGRGVISCLELPTLQEKPALFSTFMIWLLADLFSELPEVGDKDRPRLVFFLDEAHLLFKDASKAFLQTITTTVRLIRSKGVGIFFVTQTPQDVPAEVLGQLANRVQHALRAFTPQDAKALKQTVSTFPVTEYDLAEVLTSAGTGEAVVTVMDPEGSPTPVALTRMWSPQSVMGPSEAELMEQVVSSSALQATYGQAEDRDSAAERLAAGLDSGQRSTGSARHDDAAGTGGGAGGAGAAAAGGPVSTGGSVGGRVPGAGQSAADIDAEARRIEAEILGHDLPSAPARADRGADAAVTQEPAAPEPAEQPRSRRPQAEREPAPRQQADKPSEFERAMGSFMRSASTQLGREVVRSVFGTRRRRSRRGGFGGLFG